MKSNLDAVWGILILPKRCLRVLLRLEIGAPPCPSQKYPPCKGERAQVRTPGCISCVWVVFPGCFLLVPPLHPFLPVTLALFDSEVAGGHFEGTVLLNHIVVNRGLCVGVTFVNSGD